MRGLGAVLDDGDDHQSLVRLDSVVAVTFSRVQMEDPGTARAHSGGTSGPIEVGAVAVPPQSRGERTFLSPTPY